MEISNKKLSKMATFTMWIHSISEMSGQKSTNRATKMDHFRTRKVVSVIMEVSFCNSRPKIPRFSNSKTNNSNNLVLWNRHNFLKIKIRTFRFWKIYRLGYTKMVAKIGILRCKKWIRILKVKIFKEGTRYKNWWVHKIIWCRGRISIWVRISKHRSKHSQNKDQNNRTSTIMTSNNKVNNFKTKIRIPKLVKISTFQMTSTNATNNFRCIMVMVNKKGMLEMDTNKIRIWIFLMTIFNTKIKISQILKAKNRKFWKECQDPFKNPLKNSTISTTRRPKIPIRCWKIGEEMGAKGLKYGLFWL